MAQVLYNPTDRLGEKYQEKFRGHYKGRGWSIKPGEKIKVEDAVAGALLNEFGPRGLIALDYGDDNRIKEIIEDALKRNREFKIRQIDKYNQQNSERKAIGLPYLYPKGDIRTYAEELGEDLVEPYRVKDAEKQKVAEVEKENVALKEQIKAMNDKMDLLMNQMANYDSRSFRPTERIDPVEMEARDIPEDEPIAEKRKGGRPRKKR